MVPKLACLSARFLGRELAIRCLRDRLADLRAACDHHHDALAAVAHWQVLGPRVPRAPGNSAGSRPNWRTRC